MFGFVSKLRTEVTSAVTSLHERLVNLEVRVEALFKAREADVATKVDTVADKVEAVVPQAAVVDAVVDPIVETK